MARRSDVTDLLDKVLELLLGVFVFLGHLLVLGLPLVSGLLEGLDFAFVVAGLDVGLAEPVCVSWAYVWAGVAAYFSLSSRMVLSDSSASSSSTWILRCRLSAWVPA